MMLLQNGLVDQGTDPMGIGEDGTEQ